MCVVKESWYITRLRACACVHVCIRVNAYTCTLLRKRMCGNLSLPSVKQSRDYSRYNAQQQHCSQHECVWLVSSIFCWNNLSDVYPQFKHRKNLYTCQSPDHTLCMLVVICFARYGKILSLHESIIIFAQLPIKCRAKWRPQGQRQCLYGMLVTCAIALDRIRIEHIVSLVFVWCTCTVFEFGLRKINGVLKLTYHMLVMTFQHGWICRTISHGVYRHVLGSACML